jgi:hypothetical protein
MRNRIFSTDSAKAIKAAGFGYINAIQYLAPASTSGVNLCPHASPGCIALCLGWFSGQASMVADLERGSNSVRASRIAKAQRFMHERAEYMRDVVRSIAQLDDKARATGKRLCVRLNGSSDIAWEGVRCQRMVDGVVRDFRNVFEAFPEVEFVDYTKNAARFNRVLPSNYHLTLSRSETNEAQCLEALARGVNVAVVFAGDKPAQWHGFDVIDGDEHDLRQLDPRGARGFVIALSPKGGKAKRDASGFVVR